MQYRQANIEDLSGIAEVFLAAFPASVQHYAGHAIAPKVVADIFAICLDAEPEGFIVAAADGKVAGYIFAPAKLQALLGVAVRRGHFLRMFRRWITGRYSIGLKPVLLAARNWLAFWREAGDGELGIQARILSIAVSPNHQGLGIGTELVKRGLEYLHSRGARRVRLEVRPDNLSAIHIYEKLGFETKGRTRDTQGDWLIMVKDIQ